MYVRGQSETGRLSVRAENGPTVRIVPRFGNSHFSLMILACVIFTEKGIQKNPWPMRMMCDKSLGIFLLFKSQIKPWWFISSRERIWSTQM